MIYHLNIILILIGSYTVLTFNYELTNFEENILYKHLQTQTQLNSLYRKLIQSNNINDPKSLAYTINKTDIRNLNVEHKCFKSTQDLLNAFDIYPNNRNTSLTSTDIQRLLPALINIKIDDGCSKSQSRAYWKNILVGFLTVTLINCLALCGAIILPFRKKSAFKWILNVLIGLGVGTLTGSGIFHLIPMAFNLPNLDVYHSYLNKTFLTMIVIYLFYIRDQLSRVFLDVETVVCTHDHVDYELPLETESYGLVDSTSSNMEKSLSKSSKLILKNKHLNGLTENLKTMKAAAWMIFLRDLLHKFIDGLTLGAAFMVSIGEGLRICLPIICEKFPHGLDDIAVLLRSSITIRQALLVNFVSACSCYLGFLLGAKLGEFEEFHSWIYALAGGMFVYTGLVNMVPELVSIADEIEKDHIESKQSITSFLKLKILFCQNSGILLGVSIMFLLGKYGTRLENLVQF